jgi:hypothetical protein
MSKTQRAGFLNSRVTLSVLGCAAVAVAGAAYVTYPWTYDQCLIDAASKQSDTGVALAHLQCLKKFDGLSVGSKLRSAPLLTGDVLPVGSSNGNAWTQESTGSSEAGPWLKQDPKGTRYYRESDRSIVRVYPPGVRPKASPVGVDVVRNSSEQVPR